MRMLMLCHGNHVQLLQKLFVDLVKVNWLRNKLMIQFQQISFHTSRQTLTKNLKVQNGNIHNTEDGFNYGPNSCNRMVLFIVVSLNRLVKSTV